MALVDVATARARVLSACSLLPARAVPVQAALGLVTAAPLRATEPVPPFANTAMDGYAVRAADTAGAPVRLKVVATLAAGAAPHVAVGEGQAVRIMTGAPLPSGADAVVMVERTAAEGGTVVINQAAAAGDHVRAAGEDLAPGQEVFPAGTVLHPGHLGVLASMGLGEVSVLPRARVGVVSTGDELVDDNGPLRPGQIRDSNRPMLVALVQQSGCEAVDLGRRGDSETEIRSALEQGIATCDAVVTSGGVSVGDFDYVKVVLDSMAAGSGGMEWMQVAVKPAKPLAFGVVQGTPVFGLPGNPVSAMVSFELFARPALLTMMGHAVVDRPRVRAVADDGLPRRPDGKLHLVRVKVDYGEDGRYHLRSTGGHGSHLLRSMAIANGLALVPDGTGTEPGGNVDVMLLT